MAYYFFLNRGILFAVVEIDRLASDEIFNGPKTWEPTYMGTMIIGEIPVAAACHLAKARHFRKGGSDVKRVTGRKPHPVLSPRELEVLDWLKRGKTSWDIAKILDISERTVNYHVNNILQKLDVTNRLQAVFEASNLEENGNE
jgi:DNA-binding CsgD family transcriptional regulator